MNLQKLYECSPALKERVIYLEETASTIDVARKLAVKGAVGAVVIAGSQTAGRGRLGRAFFSPPGDGLYYSEVLAKPKDRQTPCTALAACAVCRTIAKLCGREGAIKWVNDVLFCGFKVCGILLESTDQALIAGIGVNLNNEKDSFGPELSHVSSLRAECGKTFSMENAAALLAENLDAVWDRIDDKAFVKEQMRYYREHLITLGREVKVSGEGGERLGWAIGLEDDGALLVEFDEGGEPERVIYGDVTVRGLKGYF